MLFQKSNDGFELLVVGTFFSILVIGGTILLGSFYFKSNEKKVVEKVVVPTPLPTAIPTVEIKKEVTFEVINASGIKGAAAKYGKQLEELGFKVIMLASSNEKHSGLELYGANDLVINIPGIKYMGEITNSTASARLVIGK
jgi:hypothetical protein